MTTDDKNTRSIGELLKLETYQGMSDEEIELIIAHKTKVEYNRGLIDGKGSASAKAFEKIAERRIEIDMKMQEMVESEWDEILNRRKALRNE